MSGNPNPCMWNLDSGGESAASQLAIGKELAELARAKKSNPWKDLKGSAAAVGSCATNLKDSAASGCSRMSMLSAVTLPEDEDVDVPPKRQRNRNRQRGKADKKRTRTTLGDRRVSNLQGESEECFLSLRDHSYDFCVRLLTLYRS